MAQVEEVEIHEGLPAVGYRPIGPVKAKVGATTAFSKAPTIESVNSKLRERAMKMGANAVIGVEYRRGISAFSWKALTAEGEAVVLESAEKSCPACGKTTHPTAQKCQFCETELTPGA